MTIMRIARRYLAALAACIAALAPVSTHAGTASGNMAVSLSISNNCAIGTSTMAFGGYDPIVTNKTTALTATGSITITCNQNTVGTVALNNGLYSANASGTTRAMASGTNYLSYELYTTSARSVVWSSTNTVSDTGTGSAQTLSVYGTIPAGQNKAIGSYSDTVTVTVTF
jgi:spore coat protein U-like protein